MQWFAATLTTKLHSVSVKETAVLGVGVAKQVWPQVIEAPHVGGKNDIIIKYQHKWFTANVHLLSFITFIYITLIIYYFWIDICD